MKSIATFLAAVAFAASANAQPFVDVGVGVSTSESCMSMGLQEKRDKRTWDYEVRVVCSRSPLAYGAIGYKFGDASVQIEHWSSIQDRDRGLTVLSVKYRFNL